jgi:DNA-binding SARP family transcriptional activator
MQGDVEGCIDQCRQVIEEQPTFGPAYNNMCLAYMQREDYERAIENCDLAVQYGYEMPDDILQELQPYRR